MNQLLATWSRRILVVTIYVALLAALLGFAVPLLLAAALADAVRRQPWTATRTLVFFAWYLLCELAGIAASLLLWLGGGPWRGGNADLYQHRNFELQNWWTRMLGRGAFRVFDDAARLAERLHEAGWRLALASSSRNAAASVRSLSGRPYCAHGRTTPTCKPWRIG